MKRKGGARPTGRAPGATNNTPTHAPPASHHERDPGEWMPLAPPWRRRPTLPTLDDIERGQI